MNLTQRQFEKKLLGYSLRFLQTRAADGYGLPPITTVYHSLPTPPSLEALIDGYFARYGKRLAPYPREAVEARLMRAYPSLIREDHLALGIVERSSFVVCRGAELDLVGVDMLVIAGPLAVTVHTYVGTSAGIRYRAKKSDGVGIPIEAVLDLKTAKQVGDFLLYNDEQIDALVAEIDGLARRVKGVN